MPAVPVFESELTASWFRAALAGSGSAGPTGEVAVERVGEGYGLTSRLFRATWQVGDAPYSVVVKLWDTGGPGGTREVEFFRRVGRRVGARIPVCLHADIDAASRRGVLVLEDLGDVEQGDCLRPVEASRATSLARLLARMHATWWANEELARDAWLPSLTPWRPSQEWIRDRRARFLARFAERLDAVTRRLLDRAEELPAIVDARIDGAPETLLHGDIHLDNVVFERPSGEAVLLDWARCARGPAAFDLAEVLFDCTVPRAWDDVITAWCEALPGTDGIRAEAAQVRPQLAGALLRRFVKCTCGVAAWLPATPREQALLDAQLERALVAVRAWAEIDPSILAGP